VGEECLTKFAAGTPLVMPANCRTSSRDGLDESLPRERVVTLVCFRPGHSVVGGSEWCRARVGDSSFGWLVTLLAKDQ
jgi:hypothetical protein